MSTTKAKSVTEYINALPTEAQEKFQELRNILKQVAPEAKESIKWGSPVLEQDRILFAYSAHKDHLNFMPTRSTLIHFTAELTDYKTGKDTIQFPYNKPLPSELIKKIAQHRLKEVIEDGALWMHHS